MPTPTFLRVDKDTVYFKGQGEFVFFIPEIFFEREHAVIDGEFIYVLGTLNYAVLPQPAKSDSDYTKNVRRFYFPSVFCTRPGNMKKVKNLVLNKSQEPQDYRVLSYTNNGQDQIIVSTKVPVDITNTEKFMSIFLITGKIPPNISYYDLYKYYNDAIKLNGGSFRVSAQLVGLIYTETCRSKDLSKPFRLTKDLDRDPYSYRTTSIQNVANLISPFTALTTENFDKSMISAALIDPKDAKSTPMERIITGG